MSTKIHDQKSELTKNQKWSFILFMLNSGVLYQIGVMTVQYYLNNDRLPLSYHFLVEIAAVILTLIIGYLAKNKSHKLKKVISVFIVIAMILVALLIPKP